MKYILIFILTILTSCTCNRQIDNTSYSNKCHKDTIQYKTIICPKCKGLGRVEMPTSGKIGYAICTLGFGLLVTDEPIECSYCNGEGYVKIPDINNY